MELFLTWTAVVVSSAALLVSIVWPVGVALFWLARLKTTVCSLRQDFKKIRDNHSHQIEELVKAQGEVGKQIVALQERTEYILDWLERVVNRMPAQEGE